MYFRKVVLACKKNQPETIYAIKAMKKDDMVQKNMIQQGMLDSGEQSRTSSFYKS